jgi:CheY-like chemotaxis protein
LLAEDNALVTETFTALLGAAGHTVTAAQDGAEAWELFLRRGGGAAFDLVLADFNMPRMNGAELLQRVRSTGFTGRVVIVSGYLETERLDELTRNGADAVIKKPVTPGKLLAAVEG